MSDLINRQAAIDALWSLDAELRPSAIDAILNMLNGLPSVQSERKTDENNHYKTGYDQGFVDACKMYEKKQPERKTGLCEYCETDRDDYVKPLEKNSHAFISYGMNGAELIVKANGWRGAVKINYCPICGRNLRKDGEG